MNVALVNDLLCGCLGEEKVFWNHLLEAFPAMVGIDTRKTGKIAFETRARRMVEEAFQGQPALVIQNATFIDRVAPDLPTIAFLQDNLRAMGRQDPRQESLLRGATLVVTNTELTAASYPEFRCRVIPIGIDETLFAPPADKAGLRRKHGLPEARPIGIFVGALNEVKGWTQVREVLESHPEIFFLLVTKHDESFEAPNARCYRKLDQRTLAELHGCSDFFLVGSKVETQCLAALEANFCGLPVVMNETGIYMDFPDRHRLGVFGKPFPEAIQEVLSRSWDTRGAILEKGLDVQTMTSRWAALLREVQALTPALQPTPHVPTWQSPTAGREELILSLLVCSLPNRIASRLPHLLSEIQKQIGPRKDVEVLVLCDNWRQSVGRKRDELIRMAQGRFLAFIDDDDRIASDYLDEILGALDTYELSGEPLDCVVFDTHFRKIDRLEVVDEYNCRYGIEYDYVKDARGWFGKPAHTMVWRSALAKRHAFSDVPWGEDVEWVKRACRDIRHQHRIPKVLYHYDWNLQESESDLHNWKRFNQVVATPEAPASAAPPKSAPSSELEPLREGFLVPGSAWGTRLQDLVRAYATAFRSADPVTILVYGQEGALDALLQGLPAEASADVPPFAATRDPSVLGAWASGCSRVHVVSPATPLTAGTLALRLGQALGR